MNGTSRREYNTAEAAVTLLWWQQEKGWVGPMPRMARRHWNAAVSTSAELCLHAAAAVRCYVSWFAM